MNLDQQIESALKKPIEVSVDQDLMHKVQRKIVMQEIIEEQRKSNIRWWLNAVLIALSILLLGVFMGPESTSKLLSYMLWAAIPAVLIVVFNKLEARLLRQSG